MFSKRKPVLRPKAPKNNQANETSPMNHPADPNVQRYSLSDPPVLPPINAAGSNDNYSYEDDITQAVDRLLGHHPQDTHPNEQTQLTPQLTTTPTISQPPQIQLNGIDAPPQMGYRPYQPGQYLAPIMTGETLQIDPAVQPSPHTSVYGSALSVQDPFHDPSTPAASVSDLSQDQGYYAPSHRTSYTSYDSASTAYDGSSTAYAGAPVDHFSRDTEAYTTSHGYSPASRRLARSREGTPGVEDEDYFVVRGNESYLQPGYEDPEKAALHNELYGPNYQAHNVVYDPEPETPKSSMFSLPETPLETRHFGPAPTGRVLRRHKTKKRVQLTNGNLVVDLKVPPKLVLPRKGEPETMHTRYTAVTCDPDEFEKKGFFLRQNETGRRTEMFIVITMYNVSLPFVVKLQPLTGLHDRKTKSFSAEPCTA